MTSLGWQVSDDDIQLALTQLGLPDDNEHVEKVRDELNAASVERAALSATDFDEQCELAATELKSQISTTFKLEG